MKRAWNMGSTCSNVEHMSKMIQIRNVPDDLHRELKVRAAERGLSLSDYLLGEIEGLVGKPTMAEFLERLRRQPTVKFEEPAAEIIRRQRGPIP